MSDPYTHTSVPPTVPQTSTTVGVPRELPHTGSDSGVLVMASLALVLVGLICLAIAGLQRSLR